MGLVILRVQLIPKPAETHCSELEQLKCRDCMGSRLYLGVINYQNICAGQ